MPSHTLLEIIASDPSLGNEYVPRIKKHPLIPSKDINDQRILQSDWLKPLWWYSLVYKIY